MDKDYLQDLFIEEVKGALNGCGSATEQINLKKYGITEGDIDHKAPYSAAEWARAYNNFEGIKVALKEMAADGQTNIMLPKGTYVVCYQNPNGKESFLNKGWEIAIPSHVTFDLNGSTIRVIFDSDNRNPYDKSTLEPYRLSGGVFAFSQSYHATICNGILLGDRYERAYTVDAEKNQEQTYGIKFDKGSEHCAVRNMEISGFMGDAITGDIGHDPDKGGVVVAGTQTYNRLMINSSGVESTTTGDTYCSDYHDLTPITSVGGKVMTVRTNIGYVREYNEGNKFSVLFYDTDKTFLSIAEYEHLDNITIPKNAVYCRLMTRSATAAASSAETLDVVYQITPPVSQFATVEHCKIYNNNRGGMSNLPNDITIRKCELYENGTTGTEGWPRFGDSTRYAINCEDTVCRKISILDNYFHDGFNCLLISAKNCVVDGNKFHNFGVEINGAGFTGYHCRNAMFVNNIVENGATPRINPGISNTDGRYVIVSNNIFRYCNLLGSDGVAFGNNILRFERIAVDHHGEKAMEGLTLEEDKTIATTYKEVDIKGKFKDSKFTMRQKLPYGGCDRITISEGTSNLNIEYTGDAVKRNYVPMGIRGAYIKGGCLTPKLNMEAWRTAIIEDSTIEPGAYCTVSTANDAMADYTFKRSKIIVGKNFNINQFMWGNFASSLTSGAGFTMLFEDCEFDVYAGTKLINITGTQYLPNITNSKITMVFKNCVFNNHTTGTIEVASFNDTSVFNADNYSVTWENNTLNGNWTEPYQLS